MSTLTIPGAVSGGTLGITDKKVLSSSLPSVIWQIPPRIGAITIQVYVTSAGSYRIETTANPVEDVIADTARWFDLLGADQSGHVQVPALSAITAIRVVRVSGTHEVCIRGQ